MQPILRTKHAGVPPERIIPVKKLVDHLLEQINERGLLIESGEMATGVELRLEHEIDVLHQMITWVDRNSGYKEPVAPGYKMCSACKRTLPVEDFHKDKYATDGHHNACKTCRKTMKTNEPRSRIQPLINMVEDDTNDFYGY